MKNVYLIIIGLVIFLIAWGVIRLLGEWTFAVMLTIIAVVFVFGSGKARFGSRSRGIQDDTGTKQK